MFEAGYVWTCMAVTAIYGSLFGFLIGQGAAYRDCARRARAAKAAQGGE